MAVESAGSSAAGDPHNGRSKNGKGEQFSKMPIDSVLSLDGLSDRAKLVYAAIQKWDWGQGCFAGHKNIAEVLRRSESTVKRGVKELKDSGLVTIKYEGRGLNAAIYVLQDQDRSDVTSQDQDRSDVTSQDQDRSDVTAQDQDRSDVTSQDQDRSDVTHLDSSDVTSLNRLDLTYPYNITDDLEIDDLETDDTPHACGDAGGDNDFSKSKREIVIQFYRKLDLPEVSKSYIKLGIRLITRLERQGYSLEQIDLCRKLDTG